MTDPYSRLLGPAVTRLIMEGEGDVARQKKTVRAMVFSATLQELNDERERCEALKLEVQKLMVYQEQYELLKGDFQQLKDERDTMITNILSAIRK